MHRGGGTKGRRHRFTRVPGWHIGVIGSRPPLRPGVRSGIARSLITGWISSVTYVAALSLWALVSGHWSAWQAARVEVRQEEDAERAQQEPLEKRVVEKVLEETTLESATNASN
jgi:hypothetical protein